VRFIDIILESKKEILERWAGWDSPALLGIKMDADRQLMHISVL